MKRVGNWLPLKYVSIMSNVKGGKDLVVYFMNEFSDLVSHNLGGGLNLRNIIQNKNKMKKQTELQNRIVSWARWMILFIKLLRLEAFLSGGNPPGFSFALLWMFERGFTKCCPLPSQMDSSVWFIVGFCSSLSFFENYQAVIQSSSANPQIPS